MSEQTRFKPKDQGAAQETAFAAAGLVRDEAAQKCSLLEDGYTLTGADYWESDPKSPEIPNGLLHHSLWAPKLCGKWMFAKDMLILEARALVKTVQRLARTRLGKNIRQLMLVDNMGVCLAFDRSRCRNFGLLIQVRRCVAFWLAKSGKDKSDRAVDSERAQQLG